MRTRVVAITALVLALPLTAAFVADLVAGRETWSHGIAGFLALATVDVIAVRGLWSAGARPLKLVEDLLLLGFSVTLLFALEHATVSHDTLWWWALLSCGGAVLGFAAIAYVILAIAFAVLLLAATRPFGASDGAMRDQYAQLRDKVAEAEAAGFVHVDTIRVFGRGVLLCFQHRDEPVLLTLSTIAIEFRHRRSDCVFAPVASLWTPYTCGASLLTVSARRIIQAIARDGSFVQFLGEGDLEDVLSIHQAARMLLENEGLVPQELARPGFAGPRSNAQRCGDTIGSNEFRRYYAEEARRDAAAVFALHAWPLRFDRLMARRLGPIHGQQTFATDLVHALARHAQLPPPRRDRYVELSLN